MPRPKAPSSPLSQPTRKLPAATKPRKRRAALPKPTADVVAFVTRVMQDDSQDVRVRLAAARLLLRSGSEGGKKTVAAAAAQTAAVGTEWAALLQHDQPLTEQ